MKVLLFTVVAVMAFLSVIVTIAVTRGLETAERVSSVAGVTVAIIALGTAISLGLRKAEPERVGVATVVSILLLGVLAVAGPVYAVPRLWPPDRPGGGPPEPGSPRWGMPRRLTDPRDGITSVTVSPDGRLLAAADEDGRVWVYETATGAKVRTLSVDMQLVTDVTFSPDGRTLAAVAGLARKVQLYSTADWSTAHTFTRFRGTVRELAYSADGGTLAVLSDAQITVLDPATDAGADPVAANVAGSAGFLSAAFTDGTATLIVADARTVRLWDVATNRATKTLVSTTTGIQKVTLSATRRHFGVTGRGGDTARIRDLTTGTAVTLDQQPADQGEVAFSRDGSRVAIEAGGAVGIWDLATGRRLDQLDLAGADLRALEFAPGDTLVGGGADNVLRIWSPEP